MRGCGGCVDVAARFNQAQHQWGQVHRNGVLELNHFHIAGVGYIERGDDAGHALLVVGVVGDDDRVVAGVDVDGVVGADEWTQHRHQVVGLLEVEFEDVRDDLTAARTAARFLYFLHTAALQLGICFGHDFVEAFGLDHGKALQTQRGQELAPCFVGRHWQFCGEVDRAFDAWVHHQVAVGQCGQSACYGFNLGVHKVECDWL